MVENTGETAGTTLTHSETAIDIADDFGTMYCREGANKGHYRQMVTPGTGAQVAGVAFPYNIELGDVYVTAGGVPGNCGLQIGGTANYIDGANPIATVSYFGVYLHAMDLEVKGEENLVFTFLASGVGTVGWLGL